MRGVKETRECAACGKSLTRLLSQAKGELWFCNHACQISLMPPPGTISKETNPYRGQKVTRPCVQCGNPVTRYMTPKRLNSRWTCSYQCMGKEQSLRLNERGIVTGGKKPRTGDMKPCSVCGKEFYRQPAYIAQGRHLCSRACNRAWQTKTPVVKQCERCGKEIILKPSQAAIRHCSRACQMDAKIKRPVGRMHNGRPVKKDEKGYVWLWEPQHPNNIYGGWQPEHRIVMEKVEGRYLTSTEQVDHINQIKHDNRPENLQILDASAHSKKTWADNLGAMNDLKAKIAEYEAELEAARKQLADLSQ